MSAGRKAEDRDFWIAVEAAAEKIVRERAGIVRAAIESGFSSESAEAQGEAFILSITYRALLPVVIGRLKADIPGELS